MSESETSPSEDEWAAALNEQAEAEQSQPAQFDELETPKFDQIAPGAPRANSEEIDMDVVLDIPVIMSLEIGRTSINIRNLLQLAEGSVVELDRLAGEPMDVLVNGTLIAHGEVVVVNDKFGIRLTDVLSPSDRIKRLG